MQVCQDRYLISKSCKVFASKSDPTKRPYRTYAFRDGEMPMCTCLPFLTGRSREAKRLGVPTSEVAYSCSHLRKVFADTCPWTQERTEDYQWSKKCPECGDQLIDTDVFDVPDDPEGQIEDLRALLAELQTLAPDEDATPAEPATGDAGDAANALLRMMK